MFWKQRWRYILVVENAQPTIPNCFIHIKSQFDNDSFFVQLEWKTCCPYYLQSWQPFLILIVRRTIRECWFDRPHWNRQYRLKCIWKPGKVQDGFFNWASLEIVFRLPPLFFFLSVRIIFTSPDTPQFFFGFYADSTQLFLQSWLRLLGWWVNRTDKDNLLDKTMHWWSYVWETEMALHIGCWKCTSNHSQLFDPY